MQEIVDDMGNINPVGNWIYHSTHSVAGLYKTQTDGTDKQQICSENASSINVIGNWIYYKADDEGLYRIKTDGADRQLVE